MYITGQYTRVVYFTGQYTRVVYFTGQYTRVVYFTGQYTRVVYFTYQYTRVVYITKRRRKNRRAITVLKKRVGGAARYDHDYRFNGLFYTFPE